jgi:Phosphopantetheine attachment site
MSEERVSLLALARQRIDDAARAFSTGRQLDGEDTRRTADAVHVEQSVVDEMVETIESAWQDISHEAPARGRNYYWEAGMSSLDLALFSDALSRRLSFDVEFADLIEYPDTDALARFLSARDADGGRAKGTSP